jgi:hypothetical protein
MTSPRNIDLSRLTAGELDTLAALAADAGLDITASTSAHTRLEPPKEIDPISDEELDAILDAEIARLRSGPQAAC